ncbi:MAG TPA: hypothetical protein ACQGQU_03355, partial [Xylella fastidiosa subsp. multiplex]
CVFSWDDVWDRGNFPFLVRPIQCGFPYGKYPLAVATGVSLPVCSHLINSRCREGVISETFAPAKNPTSTPMRLLRFLLM